MADHAASDLNALLGEDAANRRRVRMQAWRRRSRLIRRLRTVLPATIGLVLVLLAGCVLVKGWITRMIDGRSGGAAIHMTNAHFYGRDGNGRAFVLGAAEASRGNGDQRQISLTRPLLQFNTEALKSSQISADHGAYREDTHLLSLNDHVVFVDGTGDTFRTDEAMVDTQKAEVNGSKKVRGSGPRGTISADSFGVFDHGRRIVFTGNVHSIIKQD